MILGGSKIAEMNATSQTAPHMQRVTTKAIPLLDESGNAILFDMYVDGIWHGSLRTLAQCENYFKFIVSKTL